MMILTELKFTAREDFFASHCRTNLYTKSWGLGDERLHHRDRNECSFHITFLCQILQSSASKTIIAKLYIYVP